MDSKMITVSSPYTRFHFEMSLLEPGMSTSLFDVYASSEMKISSFNSSRLPPNTIELCFSRGLMEMIYDYLNCNKFSYRVYQLTEEDIYNIGYRGFLISDAKINPEFYSTKFVELLTSVQHLRLLPIYRGNFIATHTFMRAVASYLMIPFRMDHKEPKSFSDDFHDIIKLAKSIDHYYWEEKKYRALVISLNKNMDQLDLLNDKVKEALNLLPNDKTCMLMNKNELIETVWPFVSNVYQYMKLLASIKKSIIRQDNYRCISLKVIKDIAYDVYRIMSLFSPDMLSLLKAIYFEMSQIKHGKKCLDEKYVSDFISYFEEKSCTCGTNLYHAYQNRYGSSWNIGSHYYGPKHSLGEIIRCFINHVDIVWYGCEHPIDLKRRDQAIDFHRYEVEYDNIDYGCKEIDNEFFEHFCLN